MWPSGCWWNSAARAGLTAGDTRSGGGETGDNDRLRAACGASGAGPLLWRVNPTQHESHTHMHTHAHTRARTCQHLHQQRQDVLHGVLLSHVAQHRHHRLNIQGAVLDYERRGDTRPGRGRRARDGQGRNTGGGKGWAAQRALTRGRRRPQGVAVARPGGAPRPAATTAAPRAACHSAAAAVRVLKRQRKRRRQSRFCGVEWARLGLCARGAARIASSNASRQASASCGWQPDQTALVCFMARGRPAPQPRTCTSRSLMRRAVWYVSCERGCRRGCFEPRLMLSYAAARRSIAGALMQAISRRCRLRGFQGAATSSASRGAPGGHARLQHRFAPSEPRRRRRPSAQLDRWANNPAPAPRRRC